MLEASLSRRRCVAAGKAADFSLAPLRRGVAAAFYDHEGPIIVPHAPGVDLPAALGPLAGDVLLPLDAVEAELFGEQVEQVGGHFLVGIPGLGHLVSPSSLVHRVAVQVRRGLLKVGHLYRSSRSVDDCPIILTLRDRSSPSPATKPIAEQSALFDCELEQ
jgi:hypothetical protein